MTTIWMLEPHSGLPTFWGIPDSLPFELVLQSGRALFPDYLGSRYLKSLTIKCLRASADEPAVRGLTRFCSLSVSWVEGVVEVPMLQWLSGSGYKVPEHTF